MRRLMMVAAIAIAVVRAVPGAAAQQPGSADPATLLRGGFEEVSGWITKAADLVPAEKYGYKPALTVRSFGELIGHVADGNNFYCARAAGRTVDWSDPVEKGSQDKAVLMQKLKESIAVCTAAYTNTAGPLFANLSHSSLHYGNLITYLRMLGLVPPSS